MYYSISETAKLMGLSTTALRYYDKEGLIPSVERSPGGARVFTQKDFRWINLITCLKKSGMPLKDIRRYIEMTQQGEATMEARLHLFREQKERIKTQIEQLQRTLEVAEYKCWYYETAITQGSEAIPRNMPLEQLPEQLRPARQWLRSEQA